MVAAVQHHGWMVNRWTGPGCRALPNATCRYSLRCHETSPMETKVGGSEKGWSLHGLHHRDKGWWLNNSSSKLGL